MVGESQEQLGGARAQGAFSSNKRLREIYQTLDFDKTLSPDIAKKWEYTKNTSTCSVDIVVSLGNRKVWWSCGGMSDDKPHEWKVGPPQ